MKLLKKEEEKREARNLLKIKRQQGRDLMKETSEFKAKKWSDILKCHQDTCESAIKSIQENDCAVPTNIAAEYLATFKKDLRIFKRVKANVDKAAKGESSEQIDKDVSNVNTYCEDYKTNKRTFNMLQERYQKRHSE